MLTRANEIWGARKKTRIYASLKDLPLLSDTPDIMPVAMRVTSSIDQASLGVAQGAGPGNEAVRVILYTEYQESNHQDR